MWCCELRRGFFGLQPKIVLWGVWERVKLQEEGGGGGGERERGDKTKYKHVFLCVYVCVWWKQQPPKKSSCNTIYILFPPLSNY